jgi:uncharacterized protein (DUF488 family)
MSSFFTIGHSNHEFPAWLALLRRHAVEVVVDTRSSPYSKYVPQFDKELMQRSLEQAGIRYLFLGAELGGHRSCMAQTDEPIACGHLPSHTFIWRQARKDFPHYQSQRTLRGLSLQAGGRGGMPARMSP